MKAPGLVDLAIAGRALVYGSLPPAGRDLDLLVRDREERAIGASLAEAGFVCKGSEWARFASCSVGIVELARAGSWDLPADALDSLFEQATEIDGFLNLVRPSPHHTLLILARRVAYGDGVLEDKLCSRLQQALLEGPNAWDHARALAPSWRASAALNALERAWHTGEPISAPGRAAARRERRDAGKEQRGGRVMLRSTATRVVRSHRGRVVALSGLDGAGKSSQGAALQDTLECLGYKATVVRTRIAWEDTLWSIARPVRRLVRPPLRALSALRPPPPPRPRPIAREQLDQDDLAGTDEQPVTPDLVTQVRESSTLLTELWTLIITLANASSQWKLMRRHLLRGEIVISDRYTLDSIVELRYSYGPERRYRAARVALSRLYPIPVRAFFLDVSPHTALERKGEWGIEWLSEHRDLYLEECERLGVRLLDGEQLRADICAEIAREVWLSGI